jgi:ComF family protein
MGFGEYICSSCLEKVGKSSFIGRNSYALWLYEGVVRKAIIEMKYKFAYRIAGEIAEKAAYELKRREVLGSLRFILVPIPLHKKRLNFRGFNQSEEVGRILAREMGWGFLPDLLIRRGASRPQVGLKGGERRVNIKGVFVLNTKYLASLRLCGTSKILVFDDVWTTGSTINEAIKVLREIETKEIWGLAVAR